MNQPKVLLLNGSPNCNGNTAAMLKTVEAQLHEEGIETTWIHLGNKPVYGCISCNGCRQTHRCAIDKDLCNEIIEAIIASDAVIVGSPVYFAGPNGALCALLDRVFYAGQDAGSLFSGKAAAALATCWRAGATATLDRLNKYFTYSQMTVVSSEYWNMHFDRSDDEFGDRIAVTLAKNMAKALKKG